MSVSRVVLAAHFSAELTEGPVFHGRLSATENVVCTVALTHGVDEPSDHRTHCQGSSRAVRRDVRGGQCGRVFARRGVSCRATGFVSGCDRGEEGETA